MLFQAWLLKIATKSVIEKVPCGIKINLMVMKKNLLRVHVN